MRPTRRLLVSGLLATFAAPWFVTGAAAAGEGAGGAALWQALRAGTAFAVMRHADAPGFGDPAGMVIGDCSTQRNLGHRGRRQAATIGQRFRDHGIAGADVYSSPWCRCRDTAELLGLGPVETLAALGSFHGRPQLAEPQTTALKSWLAARTATTGRPLVLVTHQVNIRALTGTTTTSGETIVARRGPDGAIAVLGRFLP
jgi:broad specificity phosphatase PhoE